jgi:putative peptidoglycan lipid II flippase
LAKSAVLITAINGISLMLGFGSNVVVAKAFGTSSQMDAFQAASALPAFLATIVSGSLGYTFIPVFADRKKEDEADAWRLVSTLINLLALAGILIVILGIVFSRPLMGLLAPGFSPSQTAAASALLRWQMPIVGFSILNELMSSVYYSKSRFLRPTGFKAIAPAVTILYVLALASRVDVLSLAIAQFTCAVLQTGILAAGFLKDKDFKYTAELDLKNPDLGRVLKLMLPLLGGMCIYRIIPLAERWLASGLPSGAISTLAYAWKLVSVLSPLASAGLIVSIFPEMARLKAEGDLEGLKRVISKGIRTLIFLNTPIVFLLGVFGRDTVGLIMERGAFTHADTVATAAAMGIYLVGLPAGAVGSIVGQGYYVFKDTRTPVIIGLVETVLYLAIAYGLLPRFGILAIPIAYASYMNLSIIANALLVRAKLGGAGGSGIVRTAVWSALLSALVSLLVYGISLCTPNLFVRNAIIGSGFAAYLCLGRFVFKREEAMLIWDKLVTPTWRRVCVLFRR